VSRAVDPGRSSRRSARSRDRACARSPSSARTSTRGDGISPRTFEPSSASSYEHATWSTGSSGSASRARTRRTSGSLLLPQSPNARASVSTCIYPCSRVAADPH
jgi:hypothetical protein